jgi:transposase
VARPAQTKSLIARTKGLPEDVTALTWKAQHRLHERWKRMRAAGKDVNRIVIAMARELAGFVWALGRIVLPKLA